MIIETDRLFMVFMGIFFGAFSFVIKFPISNMIRKSNYRTDDDKRKKIKHAKYISAFLLCISLYWIGLVIGYKFLF